MKHVSGGLLKRNVIGENYEKKFTAGYYASLYSSVTKLNCHNISICRLNVYFLLATLSVGQA